MTTEQTTHGWTHNGRVVGCDARTPPDYSRLILLRETRTMWIGYLAQRFSKRSGYPVPRKQFPRERLDLATITPIGGSNP